MPENRKREPKKPTQPKTKLQSEQKQSGLGDAELAKVTGGTTIGSATGGAGAGKVEN